MCGVFGFVANKGSACDFDLLQRIAVNTETRGRHAWGVAWGDAAGRLRRVKQPGPISDADEWQAGMEGMQALIGHCRWATHGCPSHNENNHPHPADGGWIVHNGMISNDRSLSRALNVQQSSECDSELLGLAIEEADGTLLQRCAAAVERTQGQLAMLGLWSRPRRLVIVKRGKPLHVHVDTFGSLYFASLPDALPTAQRLKEGTARVLTFGRGEIEANIQGITPCPSPESDPSLARFRRVNNVRQPSGQLSWGFA